MIRPGSSFLLLFVLLLSSLRALGSDYDIQAPGRVVAFGDVHGAYDDWVALLQETEVIDDALNWTGGNTHLVSLGDLIDRGPGSREVVELMIKLDTQAEAAGGAVHIVLGNHEVMVMTGDLAYVSAAEYAAFAEDETPAQREEAFTAYRQANPGGGDQEVRATFDEMYPAGYFALRRAYGVDGTLGKWLGEQPFALKVNDKVYMHGGIAYAHMGDSLKEINDKLQSEFRSYRSDVAVLEDAGVLPPHVDYAGRLRFLNAAAEAYVAANPNMQPGWFEPMLRLFEAQEAVLFSDDSPNWYRGSAYCHPYSEAFVTERFLHRVGAQQLVIGHTPSRGQVIDRMEGRVIRLDTGMLASVYRGRAAALISGDGEDYVHYLGSEERAQASIENRSLSQKMVGMSDPEVEEFMRTGEAVAIEDIGTGITKPQRVTLRQGDKELVTAFKHEDTHPGLQDRENYVERRNKHSDRYIYDVAAYELDRLLDLQLISVTIPKTLDGQDGAMSMWMTGTINERDRLEKEIPFNSYCSQYGQYRLRFIFDILVHNDDRNLTNILWTDDSFMMRFIDHSLAFRVRDQRPKQYRKVRVELSDLFREKLEALDRSTLDETLRPYLHPRQIEAILERRDRILKESDRPAG